jgi:lipopolysaccharide transport system ATP-binding protein
MRSAETLVTSAANVQLEGANLARPRPKVRVSPARQQSIFHERGLREDSHRTPNGLETSHTSRKFSPKGGNLAGHRMSFSKKYSLPSVAPLPTLAQAGAGLAVIDDWFPNLLTGFRVAEFVHYLRVFPSLRIISTCPDLSHFAHFAKRYPDISDRVQPWHTGSFDCLRAAWFVFLNNAYFWVEEMERRSIPFVLTLYPGGGFNLNDPESEAKIVRVFASPLLRAVITTQPVTLAMLQRMGCSVPVHQIPGIVVNPSYFVNSTTRTTIPGQGAARICFAAFRYDAGGRSKGFPEFLAAANILAVRHPKVQFAVAGDLGPSDWPISGALEGRITFHGALQTSGLRAFFNEQHVIVSPSRRYATSGTSFDGFPTGSCVEAALCGVAVLSSDELDQNRYYRSGEEILICEPKPKAIAAALTPVINDPSRLAALAERGRQRTIALYGVKKQLLSRTRILRLLAAEAGLPL